MEWGLIFVVGLVIWAAFKAGRQTERDEAETGRRKREQDDIDVGTIAPIAAMMVLGKLTPQQAEREIQRSAAISSTIVDLWRSMSAEERDELGWNFVKLSMDPEYQARQQRMVGELRDTDPELWRQSEEAVSKSLTKSEG
jgi:hypothetical protein